MKSWRKKYFWFVVTVFGLLVGYTQGAALLGPTWFDVHKTEILLGWIVVAVMEFIMSLVGITVDDGFT